jgi:hypothetical protein
VQGATAGRFSLWLSSRVLATPLFDTQWEYTALLFGSQQLRTGGEASLWLRRGFPNMRTEGSLGVEGVPSGRWEVDATAGDLVLEQPAGSRGLSLTVDALPLEGVQLRLRSDRQQLGIFAGQPKYYVQPPAGAVAKPMVAGGYWIKNRGASWFGVSAAGVRDPSYVDGENTDSGGTGWLTADAGRGLSANTGVFAHLYVGTGSGLGGRAGLETHLHRADLLASVFAFGRGLPYLYPFLRPGETGVELAASFRASEMSSVFGRVSWIDGDRGTGQRRARGIVGLSRGWGTGLPAVQLVYSRDEVVFDPQSVAQQPNPTNRVAATVSQATSTDLLSLRFERVWGGAENRSQGMLTYRRAVGLRSLLNGDAIVQREPGRWGMTAESDLQFPLGGPWYGLAGLGGAFIDASGARTAEGLVKVGVLRQLIGTGLSLRVEGLMPYSVGVARSDRFRREIAVTLGYTVGWASLGELYRRVGVAPPGETVGEVTGTVTLKGQGVVGAVVVVRGTFRSTTDRRGEYRVRFVPAGPASVSVDPDSLPPRISVLGEVPRQVVVPPDGRVEVDLELSEFSFFQGSVVVCDEGKLKAVAGAVVSVGKDGVSQEVSTTTMGGFAFDRLPPGLYTVEVKLGSETLPRQVSLPKPFQVDLRRDRTGFVIRLGCS